MSAEIVSRLELIMKEERLNQSQFADKLGYKSSEKISRLFRKENAKPSVDILEDISNKFENISAKWLLTGKGEMYTTHDFKEDKPLPMSKRIDTLEHEVRVIKKAINRITNDNERAI